MKTLLAITALSALPAISGAQQMDMAAMQKWGSVELVKYHIVGVYQDATFLAADGAGQADVTDRVVIDLDWKMSQQTVVGTPAIQNFKSTVARVRDRAPSCLAPVLEGEYEHYDLVSIKAGLAGVLEFTAQTHYPVVNAQYRCTEGRRPVPAAVKSRAEEFSLPSPIMFAMGIPDSDALSISPDKKSFIMKKNGWTWTLTPTPARGKS